MTTYRTSPDMTPEHEEAGRKLARAIDRAIPKGTGFAVLLFDFGSRGNLSWISNARREDLIATMKDLIAEWEGRRVEGPRTKQ